MIPIDTRYSSIKSLTVNPFTGTARVRFASYPCVNYRFTRLYRRTLLKTIIQDYLGEGLTSPGDWVNKVCWDKVA